MFFICQIVIIKFTMDLSQVKKIGVPSSPGCYQFLDKKGSIIYIGKAANLKSRVSSYWRTSANHSPMKKEMLAKIAKIKIIETDSEIEALLLEANLIKKHHPSFNIVMRDDKRYVYIKVSTEDEIPGVFVTRKLERSGKYFGPFTSAEAVKQTLKIIRKIWPYCTERKIKSKPCFYYQINRCLGVCGGVVGRREYLNKVIKPIVLFLEGKKDKIVREYELLIKKTKNQEEVAKLKYELSNMKNVLAHANILGLSEKYASDAVELAKILNLKNVPERIEGYDIANIFGREATGAMVVFSHGEPDKNEYRKFKIRTNDGMADDTGMLREVLGRRLRHTSPPTPLLIRRGEQVERWPLPDLIVVDGGRGQLNACLSILKKNKLDIDIISISKGEGLRSAGARDKIFFPREKKPLELPLASPALHLIKRVRDEAHRFAIGYHKNLRKKRFFK